MISFLTSLYPILINLVIGSVLVISSLRLKEAGAGVVLITATLSVWAVVCAVCAWILGRILNEKNARPMIHASAALFFLSFLGLIVFPGTAMQYVWLFIIG